MFQRPWVLWKDKADHGERQRDPFYPFPGTVCPHSLSSHFNFCFYFCSHLVATLSLNSYFSKSTKRFLILKLLNLGLCSRQLLDGGGTVNLMLNDLSWRKWNFTSLPLYIQSTLGSIQFLLLQSVIFYTQVKHFILFSCMSPYVLLCFCSNYL